MKQVVEIQPIQVPSYELEVTPSDITKESDVIAKIKTIDSEAHMVNFQVIAAMVDSGEATVSRALTSDEKNKIYDMGIQGKFTEAEEFEETAKSQWEAAFIKYLQG